MRNNKTLYSEIIDFLKEKIESGELVPKQQLPTEMELAKQFNVSRITSKRAMEELEHEGLIYRKKGSGSFVIQQEDSEKNAVINNNMNVIALIIPFSNSLGRGMELIHGLSKSLSKNSYYLVVHISNQNADEERRIINEMVNNGVKGIILYPVSNRRNIDLINKLLLDGYPIITIDRYYDALPVSCVLSDNFNGSYLATSHLIDLGHREIFFVTDYNLESATSVRARYFGFCKALKDNGILLGNGRIIYIESLHNNILNFTKNINTFSDGVLKPFKEVITKLIAAPSKCTAIHAAYDYLAIFLLKSALEMGISIPNDLAIVGFDNIENTLFFEVPLTTVDQNFNKIGEKAGDLIIKIISTGSNLQDRIILPVELIIRDSTVGSGFQKKESKINDSNLKLIKFF